VVSSSTSAPLFLFTIGSASLHNVPESWGVLSRSLLKESCDGALVPSGCVLAASVHVNFVGDARRKLM